MTEDKILLTARYVEGDMDQVERAGFEKRMQEDADLQQHLKDYNEIHQSLKIHLATDQKDQLIDTLNAFNEQYFKAESKVVLMKQYIKWFTAVAAVLFAGLLIWAPWQEDLYHSYAIGNKMMVTERGAEKETRLDKAASLYNKGDYNAAKNLLEKEYTIQPNNAMLGYYYGISLIETAQINEGRGILLKIFAGESVFKYDAAYFIAMSYLKEKNRTGCKAWLQKIPAGTSHYNQAQELIKIL